MAGPDLSELHDDIRALGVPHLNPDERFLVWFLRAYFQLDLQTAEHSLLGQSHDKGVDALHIDEQEKTVHVIQAKYHLRGAAEERDGVISFAALGQILTSKSDKRAETLAATAHPALIDKVRVIRDRVRQRGYALRLLFVTTGRVSSATAADANLQIEGRSHVQLEPFGGRELMSLWQDYKEGAAPPVPKVRLAVRDKEEFTFIDRRTGFRSHLASIATESIAGLYAKYGVRIFARNIRGYLGRPTSTMSTRAKEVNGQIAQTLKSQPAYFWYYNNGITMVADAADATATYVDVTNAQVINGQQTTRVIAESKGKSSPAAVLVKVIVIPKATAVQRKRYGQVINQIVKATNWQNQITLSDLQTNDDEQIRLERILLEHDYNYIRRRQSSTETQRLLPRKRRPKVAKEKLAQYIAACELDHVIAQAKNRLFDADHYSQIFKRTRTAEEYILFYWLGTAVESAARRVRERRYAKWLVLATLWRRTPILRRSAFREAFIHLAEADRRFQSDLLPLRRVLDEYFELAADAFRRTQKREPDLDLPTFFKRANAAAAIDKAIQARANSARRSRLSRYLAELERGLRVEEKAA
ncbi:MAG: AIPR family protein [Chloroflexota bacterium]